MSCPHPFDARRFAAMPLIGILRGQPARVIEPLVQALADGGFTALEITMNSPGAAAQIHAAVNKAGDRIAIGAGTVTSLAELDEAHTAGASFIVTPIVVPEVITECVRRGLPVFPGAFTPTEVHQAHRLGATMVKLFPANRLGPGYVRDLQAPLSSVRLLATGGITPEVIPEYVAAGVAGFGIGSPLLTPARIETGDWDWLRQRAREFCAAWAASRADTDP
ncbi:MAG TPA: bifunctional 4-hydroxy-2-oxoglutarate aldolase/2-dehydro-3-deoxy-phosphogluconate aldolase [Lacunisphaera sp.]|jgi:2-dehydro-3-deoxyphosphogluconate aldolase/(4S)-4-hydroxy-2-oxoglutarate aldolase|nr:bifunctional 4-hydroxy-2-oxoglutarate aldolase/2-dehydro-3-deoxy-phosphogluconate aldolase [Lacunisphaera sp.]HQY06285.1 bifunctional 4-hydroxy-2-oxoglutarate aldolase/2-dehydro-3-deoxy-phosphogluconate aldolase [Lacunisphaera sp.]